MILDRRVTFSFKLIAVIYCMVVTYSTAEAPDPECTLSLKATAESKARCHTLSAAVGALWDLCFIKHV